MTTINKSQGQTLKTVGVWLRQPVFTHGQLYVAFSRTGIPDQLKIAIQPKINQDDKSTAHPVFYEFLLPQEDRLSIHMNERCLYDKIDENIEGFLLANELAGADLEDDI